MNTTHTPDRIERLARRRAAAKMGWLIHAFVYVCVNAGLMLLSLPYGRHWSVFPLLGWGLGLALHGAAVWLFSPGARLHEAMIERERAALRRDR